MECILGEKNLVVEEVNSSFMFTINESTEILMSSYEMAKFMYLLRSYLYQEDIDQLVTKFIALEATYQSEENSKDLFKANIWLVKNEDSMTVNVHYTRINGEYKSARYENEFTAPEVTTDISFEWAQQLVYDYIDYEYNLLCTDD